MTGRGPVRRPPLAAHAFALTEAPLSKLQPFYRQVQAHYDLSNDFFELFLDPSMAYSCAYFEPPEVSLELAQRNKIDLALGKCDLKPGQRLLDIGCGWGATIRRAVEHYGVTTIGLTLSQKQRDLARERLADLGDRAEIRLQGWEEFDEPVDRIVSIGAFEHFREERFAEFFAKCHRLLPADGRMLLHTIVKRSQAEINALGVEITHEDVLFNKFILKTIFPGGQLRPADVVRRHIEARAFRVERVHPLRLHYARTLDAWAANLESARERAIGLTSPEMYDTYMRYLTGCAHYFRIGYLDVIQFTCCK
jgi:cyclopropane-fatty-acyl-phospholipid synthase